ncbi:MAG: hypothetical protein K8W52_04965, partial [Deltaproteobacteria bacterium]|nr:hypothetical protein [Deltaproteobacteria bacterium]
MPGGSYFLVSGCSSADDFVAAFRTFADRGSLFVPTAHPLPVGTHAHIAVCLADGGVMIEGDAEVTSSSARAVGLHARPGMAVRFIKLDDTSKQVMDQLVRARLSARSVPLPTHLRPKPRPGTVPEASPALTARPRPTVIGVAVAPPDAGASPAECSVIAVPEAI